MAQPPPTPLSSALPSDSVSSVWTKSLSPVPIINQQIIEDWANDDSNKIPRAKQTKGYSNWIEGYIHDVEVMQNSMSAVTHIRGKCFASMKKHQAPYKVQVSINQQLKIRNCKCECKAGAGSCSHMIGLLYTISHYQKMGYTAVPPTISQTSLPQTWHIPSRSYGLSAKPIDNISISKIKSNAPATNKKKRNVDGVLPSIYCPVEQPIPAKKFASELLKQLKQSNSSAEICKHLVDVEQLKMSDSSYGPVFHGSPLSYQQRPKPIDESSNFQFPFTLPNISNNFCYALSEVKCSRFAGLQLDMSTALALEKETRKQSDSIVWQNARTGRITSSKFKQVCCRRTDFESLAKRLLIVKTIQTAAMKRGLEMEPQAAEHYSNLTGRKVYRCGLVVNPTAPHLGTSPDRIVLDETASSEYGLLEIKCPVVDTFEDCKYLTTSASRCHLKHRHEYMYQIIGQMGITGAQWCDFFVQAKNDYHLERIQFDENMWMEIKNQLDMFFFNYFL